MELPEEVPVMTLPEATLLPEALLPLYIFEMRYRRMLADVLRSHRMFVLAMQKPGARKGTPMTVAGLGLVSVCVEHDDGTSHLILQGLSRVELTHLVQQRPFPVRTIKPLRTPSRDSVAIDALLAKVRDLVTERIQLGFSSECPSTREIKAKTKPLQAMLTAPVILGCLEKLTNPDQVADLVSSTMLSLAAQKQVILETVEIEPRLRYLIHFLMAEINLSKKKLPHE